MAQSCGFFPMDHDQITAWVRSHPSVLAADLAEISRYPVPFRKVIVSMMLPEQWVSVWRQQLESSIAGDDEYTAEQRAFVVESAAALRSLRGSASERNAWEARASQLFTHQQRAQIFESLGTPEPPEGLPLPPDAMPVRAN